MKVKFEILLLVIIFGLFSPVLRANDFHSELDALVALGQLRAAPTILDTQGNATSVEAGELKTVYFSRLFKKVRIFAGFIPDMEIMD